MNFSSHEFNILSYMLRKNRFTYSQVINWAYSQYSDQGIDPFIEKIGLALDKEEIVELISSEFQVYGKPKPEFLTGEVVKRYESNELSLCEALRVILYDLDIELIKAKKTELYIAEDYYDWHESPDEKAKIHAERIFEEYLPVYENEIAKFTT